MGKAQSKRSVDITTEPSKEIQEGSGELKKLDDAYFKENESSDKENKVANDAAENEKNESVKVEEVAAPDVPAPVPAPESEENKTEAPSGDEKISEDIKEATPEPDSAVKPKKEKVKKKWSFRSISFGKKDKQKPSKKDKKNEDNKAVAEGAEVDVESKAADEKPQETLTEAAEVKPLEAVVEVAATEVKEEEVKPKEEVKEVKPVARVEPVREKTPEPVVVEATVEVTKKVDEAPPAPIEAPPAPVEDIPEPAPLPVVEEPPAIPTTPPPSQFSVFAESMNTPTVEENLPEPVVEAEVEDPIVMEIIVEQVQLIDVEPVAAMIEKVLEQAVDRIELEKADEELPPPPADETPEVVEAVIQNGVGDHKDEPVEAVKLENGVHNGDDVNESKPIVEELKKEDKVSDKIAQDSPLAPEIISE